MLVTRGCWRSQATVAGVPLPAALRRIPFAMEAMGERPGSPGGSGGKEQPNREDAL